MESEEVAVGKETEGSDTVIYLRFTPEEEHSYYVSLRSQLIKLLYIIESEAKGETDATLWFYGFVFDLASANTLCNNKLTRVLVKIHGLYDGHAYRDMTHDQIKRQIMECKGIVDHLIRDAR